MTKRKMKTMSSKAMRIMPTIVMSSKVSELVRLVDEQVEGGHKVISLYHTDFHRKTNCVITNCL
jgi:hypothetical protein